MAFARITRWRRGIFSADEETPGSHLRISQGIVKKFEREGEDHGEEDGTNEFCAAKDDHARTNARAQELADAHGESGAVIYLAGPEKKSEGGECAGKVHDLGVAGGFRQ